MSASKLMDELFAELEQDLDVGTLTTRVLPAKKPVRSVHQLKTTVSTWSPQEQPSLYPLEDALDDPIPQAGSSIKQARSNHFPYGVLLLGVAAVTLMIPLLLWRGSQIQRPATVTPTPTPQVIGLEGDAASIEFAAYVQRSLDLIEKRAQATQVAPTTTQQVGIPATNPSTTPNAAPGPLDVVTLPERIYVPVYQPPQLRTQTLEVNKQAAKPAKPKNIYQASAPAPPVTPTTPVVLPTPTEVLVGILELGDRSAALVGSNGVTRRVRVGETLNSQGWSLAKVSGQKAVIRRKGELRSIDVGEKF